MRATEQLSSMEMMAVDPLRRVISPVSGWGYFITTVDGYFRRRGDLGRISGRRQLERH